MVAEIVPFGMARAHAERLIRSLSTDSRNLVIEPYFSMRMRERSITMTQVLITLREGHVNPGPKQDEYGEWRCRLRKRVAGRGVHVVVAISGDRKRLSLVTTY